MLDASAAIEWLRGSELGGRVRDRAVLDGSVQVPELWDLEIAQVLRRLERARTLPTAQADASLSLARVLPAARTSHGSLIPRVWQLRANLSAYDATYVALAEALEAPLITTDRRLAEAPGHRAEVELLS